MLSELTPAGLDMTVPTRATQANAEPPSRGLMIFVLVLALSIDYRFLHGVSGIFSITLAEILAFLAVARMCIDSVFTSHVIVKNIWQRIGQNPFLALYFAWAFIGAIAGLLTGLGAQGLADFKDLIPSIIVMLFFAVYATPKDIPWIWRALIIGIAINVALGVCQSVLGGPRPVALTEAVAYKMDLNGKAVTANVPSGFFSHPNAFATFLLPNLALLMPVLTGGIRLRLHWRIASFLLMLGILFCILRAEGKSAMAWGMLGVVLYMSSRMWRRHIALASIAVTLGALVTIVVASNYLAYTHQSLVTIWTRIELWRAGLFGLTESAQQFMFGVPLRQMLDLTWNETGGHFPYWNSHNGWINQALNYGFPALLMYAAAIRKEITNAGRAIISGKGDENVRCAGLAVIAGICALSGEYFFEPSAEGVVMQLQFFILLAIAGIVGRAAPSARLKPALVAVPV